VGENSKIRLRGKGQPGRNGNHGDLIITVGVEPHPYFERQGNDIYLDVPLTFKEAALGTKLEVPTLTSPTTVTIPPGSGGRKLRLRGKGVHPPRTGAAGDMYLVLKVMPPTSLDEADRQALEELARKHPQTDIRAHWR
jgi:DnaJ-class molecular chaperone